MTEQLQAGGRIVVGTDLSHNADHAVDWAAERAVEVGAPLLVVL
ncbi:MAG: universal stress protein, partial [Propioniciclava sp.]|nr:universal stress protein [Propioniciclava sp.]